MRCLKEMIVENCKLYYQSEERNRIPEDRALPLSNNATYGVSTGSKRTTGATISMRAEIPLKYNEWRLIRDVFLTKLENDVNSTNSAAGICTDGFGRMSRT